MFWMSDREMAFIFARAMAYQCFSMAAAAVCPALAHTGILPFLKAKGVRRIDYWFVSHTDADHINGLEEILQLDYPIGTVVFPEYGYRDASLEKLEEEIERNGITICYLKAKESLRTKNDRITCIFPTADYPVERCQCRFDGVIV